ncbi:hypothetical protein C5E43_26725 [Nocardia cyriacigeorgica]|nr:hypothetical protein C5E43_26725 [Nocardia cyriacigeorgica]
MTRAGSCDGPADAHRAAQALPARWAYPCPGAFGEGDARKVGHVNALGDDVATVQEKAERRLIGSRRGSRYPGARNLPLQHNHGRPWRHEGTSSTGKRT